MAGMDGPLLSNVSDTARWVALYRAWESARKDALFRDPFAERFAGRRAEAIAARIPRSGRNGWPIIARTKLIDDLVLSSVATGCDCVLNLAAGFDTRPYRLKLPPSLLWIEADLPPLLEEKERLLAGAVPICQLRREKIDLADSTSRAAFLAVATLGSRAVLVITEGLLPYLQDDEVRGLSRDLHALRPLRFWVLDFFSPAIRDQMTQRTGGLFDRAPLRFAPPEGVRFFELLGWSVCNVENLLKSAARFHRLTWPMRLLALLPSSDPRKVGKGYWSAVVRLERRGAGAALKSS
jgi:methyltransferase (TIGR00027 family)